MLIISTIGCHHENETEYYVNSKRELTVGLGNAAFNLRIPPSFSFFQINNDGFGVPINGRYANDHKKLSLDLDLNLALNQSLSVADQIAGLTAKTNTTLLEESSWHGKTSKSLRFELRPALEEEKLTQKLWYSQSTVPISHLEFASNTSKINSKLRIELVEVGFAKFYVHDTLGNAIQGAKLTPLLESTTDLGFGNTSLSLHDPYRPVRSATNIHGFAQVGPLYISDEKAHFRVHAWAPGYCSYITEPVLYSGLGEAAPQIMLKKCDEREGVLFTAEFSNMENTYREFHDLKEYNIAYTNQDELRIRIDHHLEIPSSGFIVKIFEGFTYPYQSDPIFEHKYERFESEISIPTPIAFKTGSALSGSFSIDILTNNNSESKQNESTRLLAKKNIGKPSLEFLDSIIIGNNTGAKNIISGTDKGEFFIRSEMCKDGNSLGFMNNFQEYFFSLCEDLKANFKSKEIQLFRDLEQQGGYERIKVYLKDKFGNISDDDPNGNNEKQIFVDYGEPEINSLSLKLGIQIGFIQIEQIIGSGTNLDPYQFNSEETLILQAKQLQNYRFGFSKPANCLLSKGSIKDGEGSLNTGLEISGFLVNPEISDQTYGCQTSDTTNMITIEDQMLEFPMQTDQNALFKLQIIDSAGNQSQPYTINIPSCSQIVPEGTHVCWSP